MKPSRFVKGLHIVLVLAVTTGSGQDAPRRLLRQGAISGVKLFTDGRVSVNAYLGIPYAAAPVGPLRFAPPERHGGWNGSFFAGAFASPCPQPRPEAVFDDSHESASVTMQLTDEDCLYLNVWTPDNMNLPGRPQLPVMVFLEGETFVFGSPSRFPAMQELSSRGAVVISVSYRLNVFGFLCFGEAVSRGNMGLLDQYVALRWVQENAASFGGDPNRVTLVGHSAGAASVFFHLLSPKTKGLFQSAILMSGSGLAPWALSRPTFSPADSHAHHRLVLPASAAVAASLSIAKSLGCASMASVFPPTDFHYSPSGQPSVAVDYSSRGSYSTVFDGARSMTVAREMMACLRTKTTEELLRAFHAHYKSQNGSTALLPVVDSFLPDTEQYFPIDPLRCMLEREAVEPTASEWVLGKVGACLEGFPKVEIPVMTGVASHDGVVNLYGRGESLAREGYAQLRRFFESSAIPTAVVQYGASEDSHRLSSMSSESSMLPSTLAIVVQEALRFEYADRAPDGDTEALLAQLIEFYTDSQFRSPHERQLRFLSLITTTPIYAYVLEGTSYGGGYGSSGVPPAAGGGGINVSGAGHGSDLVLLFGSQAMQRASGRRFSAAEERLSDAIQRLWLEFMKQGNPTPNAYGYGPQWRQYNSGGDAGSPRGYMSLERQQMRATPGSSTGSGQDLRRRISLWNAFLPRLSRTLRAIEADHGRGGFGLAGGGDSLSENDDPSQPFRNLTYILSGVIGLLLVTLLLCIIFLRKRWRDKSAAGDPLGEGDLDDAEAMAAVSSSSNMVSVVRGNGLRPSSGPRRCLPPAAAAASLASLNSLSANNGKYSSGAWRYNLSANQL